MSDFCIASMSSQQGWMVSSPEEAIDAHYNYWFQTKANQGRHITNTPSFFTVWYKNYTNPDNLAAEVKEVLTRHMEDAFGRTVVVYTNVVNVSDKVYTYNLEVSVGVVVNGKQYSVGEVISYNNDRYERINSARLKDVQ